MVPGALTFFRVPGTSLLLHGGSFSVIALKARITENCRLLIGDMKRGSFREGIILTSELKELSKSF